MTRGRPRKPPAQHEAPRPKAERLREAALRSLVAGVEIVGELPPDRGIARWRLRITPAVGGSIPANLHRSAEQGCWISIEALGMAEAIAGQLAEAALLRLQQVSIDRLPRIETQFSANSA